MKILALADEECPTLWDYYTPGCLDEYDLIISSGDLKSSYLSFLVTMAKCPVLYVHGNHDGAYLNQPPKGCECIDGKLVNYKGVRILGLGGCIEYSSGPFQFTQKQMNKRIRKLKWALWRAKGVDIVVTHAAPRGVGDAEDFAHRGFSGFLDLIEKYHPKFLLHGHVHLRYGANIKREQEYRGTKIINVCGKYTLDYLENFVSHH
ncbi:MAG: metallophosphoesterase family protein [Lachnospiraceae bacterium]|nr:metallophosphoesterase family protein [Lachnospiraceae bacterium]